MGQTSFGSCSSGGSRGLQASEFMLARSAALAAEI